MKSMLIECPTCGRRVDADIVGRYGYHDRAEGGPCMITLLRCPRCEHSILVREEEVWEESWTAPKIIFPVTTDTLNPDIPNPIRSMFQEARTTYRAGAATASALMCRKTLEGMCSLHGIKERNLDLSLKKAVETGLIDGRLYEWADELRITGNEAAHDVEAQITGEDARDLVEFTEAILEYVYTFRDRFDRFKERRRRRKAKDDGSGDKPSH